MYHPDPPKEGNPAPALADRSSRAGKGLDCGPMETDAKMLHDILPRGLASTWEARFRSVVAGGGDAAHDPGHFARVARWSLRLAALEGADPATVWAAAWLHDMVHVPKNSPDRSKASRFSATAARAWLEREGWDASPLDGVEHAIEAHSFSAGIPVRTMEAAVVQDADRLEALGAIGLARCLMLGGQMGSKLVDFEDPWARSRPLTDDRISVDHFFAKLLKLPGTMKTESGTREAARRVGILRSFLEELAREADLPAPPLVP